MKTLQQLFAAILLAFALSISTFAGEMSGPGQVNSPLPLPTDGSSTTNTATPATIPCDNDSPGLTVLAVEFLMSALSIY